MTANGGILLTEHEARWLFLGRQPVRIVERGWNQGLLLCFRVANAPFTLRCGQCVTPWCAMPTTRAGGGNILYPAADADSVCSRGGKAERFGLLANEALAQIDAAFRNLSVSAVTGESQSDVSAHEPLSARERGVWAWWQKAAATRESGFAFPSAASL